MYVAVIGGARTTCGHDVHTHTRTYLYRHTRAHAYTGTRARTHTRLDDITDISFVHHAGTHAFTYDECTHVVCTSIVRARPCVCMYICCGQCVGQRLTDEQLLHTRSIAATATALGIGASMPPPSWTNRPSDRPTDDRPLIVMMADDAALLSALCC